MVLGVVISYGGLTRNTGAGWAGWHAGAAGDSFSGGCPGLKAGTTSEYCTVSIQKVAFICTALALGVEAAALPSRKAMFAVPPPNSGGAGDVDTVKAVVWMMVCPSMALRRTVLGSSRMSWVMVPAAMNFERSGGSLREEAFAATRLSTGTS